MRKFLLGIALIVIIGASAFFIFAPRIVDSDMNGIDGAPLPAVTAEAQALHATLSIVDLHSDTLLWKRDILERHDYGHMDMPRLRDGNVALQVFSSVTKTPRNQNYDNNSADGDNVTALVVGQLQPPRTWTSLLERSLFHAQKLDEAADETGSGIVKVRAAGDVADLLTARAADQDAVGALFSAEGLHNLEGELSNLTVLYDAGLRMAGLTHFFDNDLAGSMHGEGKGGLTDMGRSAVRDMEEMGIIVDIAHCSAACVDDILTIARRPVVSSHGGVRATCDVNRNLNDDQIRKVAENGGIIGVGYWEGAVCDTSPQAIVRAMQHIRDLVGIEHVALGSDYDGTVLVRFDTAGLVHITQALIDAEFTEDEIRAAMGGNALRLIEQGLIPMADLPDETTNDEEDS
ncbi:membrane dipeptidase [Erythrobacter sp. Alg231-14]|uniref:membrane dipeptidase n=1 Tax=Erythrobacter sp. Alg231-14 TaxID=1922225 RepID=UPI000D54B089